MTITKTFDDNGNEICVLCGKKLGMMQKMHINAYTHKLSDGVPCKECNWKLVILLLYRKYWAEPEAYAQAVSRQYDWTEQYVMPVKDAKALLSLRDEICERFLRKAGVEEGSVFVALERFKMPPSPSIFILRARKVRNKMTIRGLCLKGTLKRGDHVRIQMDGKSRDVEIVEVVPNPKENGYFDKETFFNELTANIHDHTLSECEEGWLILDLEEQEECPRGGFLAGI